MNNKEKLEDFIKHLPTTITKSMQDELFKDIIELIDSGKNIKLEIQNDYKLLKLEVKEENTITTRTIDITKILPKKKNKFLEWLNK